MKTIIRFFRSIANLPEELENIKRSIVTLRASVNNIGEHVDACFSEHKSMVEQQDRLRNYVATIESAGIRNTFGGRIDIDFDRFLNTLSESDQDELIVMLENKIAERARRKKTPRAGGKTVP